MEFATIIRRSARGGFEMVRGGRRHQEPIRVDPDARLWMNEDTGVMYIDFADCEDSEAVHDLAGAYGLEVDCYTVCLGHADDGGLPSEYVDLMGDAWKELAGW